MSTTIIIHGEDYYQSKVHGRTGCKWTSQEVQYLKEHYRNDSNEYIGEYLDRSAGAVKQKAYVLHIYNPITRNNSNVMRNRIIGNYKHKGGS